MEQPIGTSRQEERVDDLNRFVLLYNTYLDSPRDYGTGQLVSTVEVHILAHIWSHPGITVTELARLWLRTKGAISQTVSKLEEKGYIYREREMTDAKVMHLFATQTGVQLCEIHRQYDIEHVDSTHALLLDECSMGDIDAFYRVLKSFTQRLGNVLLEK